MINRLDVHDAIYSFVIASDAAKKISRKDITDSTRLMADGLLDSLSFVNLISFMEERFKLDIDLADVEIDDFETAGSLATLIERAARSST